MPEFKLKSTVWYQHLFRFFLFKIAKIVDLKMHQFFLVLSKLMKRWHFRWPLLWAKKCKYIFLETLAKCINQSTLKVWSTPFGCNVWSGKNNLYNRNWYHWLAAFFGSRLKLLWFRWSKQRLYLLIEITTLLHSRCINERWVYKVCSLSRTPFLCNLNTLISNTDHNIGVRLL